MKKPAHCAPVPGYIGPLGGTTANKLKLCWFSCIWSLFI